MRSMRNHVHLVGNLGMTPESREVSTGAKLAKFSLATNESYYTSEGARKTETQWHSLVAWGEAADKAERLLVKGQEIALSGRIVSGTYTDKQGVSRTVTEIQVTDFVIIGKNKK